MFAPWMCDAQLVEFDPYRTSALKSPPERLESRVNPLAARGELSASSSAAMSILPSRRHRLVALSCSETALGFVDSGANILDVEIDMRRLCVQRLQPFLGRPVARVRVEGETPSLRLQFHGTRLGGCELVLKFGDDAAAPPQLLQSFQNTVLLENPACRLSRYAAATSPLT